MNFLAFVVGFVGSFILTGYYINVFIELDNRNFKNRKEFLLSLIPFGMWVLHFKSKFDSLDE